MISIKSIPLNYNEQTGLKGIIEELTGKYLYIRKIILYGSKARGDYIEESDLDLLFITANDISRSLKMEMIDVIYNHELANDIVVSAIFVSETEFSESISLFLRKVKKEGIMIWSRE